MSESSIPIDLLNPGHVFACMGLTELAEVLAGPVEAKIDWEGSEGTAFQLRGAHVDDPIQSVLHFLSRAETYGSAPLGSENSLRKWKVTTKVREEGSPFPMPDPESPATLPVTLSDGEHEITLHSFGDATKRDNVKFWAGSGGYPAAALVRDALDLVRADLKGRVTDPFNLGKPQSSSLRFDWRRDYVPMDTGFSLNSHSSMEPMGYPVVELLSLVGLNHARPQRPDPRQKLHYRYAVVGGNWLRPIVHRLALGCESLPFPTRRFSMQLDWPGQEGQARCITSVTEDPTW